MVTVHLKDAEVLHFENVIDCKIPPGATDILMIVRKTNIDEPEIIFIPLSSIKYAVYN